MKGVMESDGGCGEGSSTPVQPTSPEYSREPTTSASSDATPKYQHKSPGKKVLQSSLYRILGHRTTANSSCTAGPTSSATPPTEKRFTTNASPVLPLSSSKGGFDDTMSPAILGKAAIVGQSAASPKYPVSMRVAPAVPKTLPVSTVTSASITGSPCQLQMAVIVHKSSQTASSATSSSSEISDMLTITLKDIDSALTKSQTEPEKSPLPTAALKKNTGNESKCPETPSSSSKTATLLIGRASKADLSWPAAVSPTGWRSSPRERIASPSAGSNMNVGVAFNQSPVVIAPAANMAAEILPVSSGITVSSLSEGAVTVANQSEGEVMPSAFQVNLAEAISHALR
jgi:hypothetical protein